MWSLLDIVEYAILLLKVAADWWKLLGYFGDGILFADLNVSGLLVQQGTAGQFVKHFGPVEGDYALPADVLSVYSAQRNESQGYLPINSATLLDNIPRIVTSIMNQLLRSLGHGVDFEEFENSVRIIVAGMVKTLPFLETKHE